MPRKAMAAAIKQLVRVKGEIRDSRVIPPYRQRGTMDFVILFNSASAACRDTPGFSNAMAYKLVSFRSGTKKEQPLNAKPGPSRPAIVKVWPFAWKLLPIARGSECKAVCQKR